MIGEQVTRLRAGASTGRYGDTVETWDDPTSSTIYGCAFSPGGTSEDHDGRDAIVQTPTLYAPPGTDILASDRLVIRGTTYEVEGQPGTWVSPYSGSEEGIEVPLRVVTG